MITFEHALQSVLTFEASSAIEAVSLAAALDRILAHDVASDVDVPAADVSAMDGFACRTADIAEPLRVVETIAAGHSPTKSVGQGECSRIMTGAVVPPGADRVAMVEHTTEEHGLVRVVTPSDARNIRRAAEDVRLGDVVLRAGTRISPPVIAMLASAGCASVDVRVQPVVGIIATGDELVEPAQTPGPAQIRNSNSHQLHAQVQRCGCVPRYYGIVPDSPDATVSIIAKALGESDVLLLSGGVSAGEFDFVPDALRKLGVAIRFEGIAMKPGKPTLFGALGQKTVFGMPGNPVSTFVVFEMLVRPHLLMRMGHRRQPLTIRAMLAEAYSRRKADRLEFVPVAVLGDGTVRVPEYHGSAHIHAFGGAQGIMPVAVNVTAIPAGTMVDVVLLV
jgi:molybdopterin molybdotransferase